MKTIQAKRTAIKNNENHVVNAVNLEEKLKFVDKLLDEALVENHKPISAIGDHIPIEFEISKGEVSQWKAIGI